MRTPTVALFLLCAAQGLAGQKPAPPKNDINVASPGVRGLPAPRLELLPGLSIDSKAEKLQGEIWVTVGPHGELFTQTGSLSAIMFDSAGRHRWSLNLRGQDEIGDVSAMGWRGAGIWAFDRRFSQIALIDHGTVTKSLELPSWFRPSWTNRKTFPVFGTADIYALLDDGSMIVAPHRPHEVVGTVGYDSTMQYVVRVDENGIIQTPIAKLPGQDYGLRAAMRTASRDRSDDLPPNWPLPRDYWPRLRVSPDGARTVVVSVDTTHASTDSVVVAAWNDKGEPVYTRRFGFPRMTFTDAQMDSIGQVRLPRLPVDQRARRIKSIPRSVATIRDVILGNDHSVWITLREIDGATPVVGLDSAGRFVGTAYIPAIFRLKGVDRGLLWIANYRPALRELTRYSVVAPRR